MNRIFFAVYATVALLTSQAANAFTSDDSTSILKLVNNPVLIQALYLHPANLLSGVGDVAANGAVAGNAASGAVVDIEGQRWGADLVAAALITHQDPSLGIATINFGAAQMQSNGSFGSANHFLAENFFLESWARTLLMLKETGNPAYTPMINSQIGNLAKAMHYYISSGDFLTEDGKCQTDFTHRCFLNAAALGEVASLASDPQLAAMALQSAQSGLNRQLQDGTFPEKGGFDINYNAASIMFASRYLMVCKDANMKALLLKAIHRAGERESQEVSEDGELSMIGSTRTGIDEKHDGSGDTKGFDTKGIVHALVYSGQVDVLAGSRNNGERDLMEAGSIVAKNRGW